MRLLDEGIGDAVVWKVDKGWKWSELIGAAQVCALHSPICEDNASIFSATADEHSCASDRSELFVEKTHCDTEGRTKTSTTRQNGPSAGHRAMR